MSNRLQFDQPSRLSTPEALAPSRPPLWDQLRAAWRRHHSRQRIAELDPYLLKDIGITHSDAELEANKPFWRD
jgi:uncharacterized protein YjiS (DUF1127 family)